jgi:hypothetical protein
MRSGSFLAVCTAVVCLAAAAPVRAVTPIFLVDTETGSPSQIYRVNRVTGELALIGTLPPDYSDAAGLAAADQNTLYVATLASPIANRILRVTVNPFSFEELGAINGSFAGLAYANGQLFGIDEFSEQLYRIGLTPPISLTLVGGRPGRQPERPHPRPRRRRHRARWRRQPLPVDELHPRPLPAERHHRRRNSARSLDDGGARRPAWRSTTRAGARSSPRPG